jgi:RNA polymerase sigma-B factor
MNRSVGRADGDGPQLAHRFAEYRRTGAESLRNALVAEHLSVAQAIARRFAGRGEPLDDLEQVATVGLVKAVERFDPDLGVPFVGYAVPTITGELRRHFRDRTWVVKVSRRAKDLHVQLPAVVDRLSADLGRPPTPAEIADELGRSLDEVLDALDAEAAYRTVSTDTVEGAAAAGRALRRSMPTDLALADDRMLVEDLLRTLPEREEQIVRLRFFEDLSQPEIAARVGISQVHVSRLLRQSLAALQAQAVADRGRAEPSRST